MNKSASELGKLSAQKKKERGEMADHIKMMNKRRALKMKLKKRNPELLNEK